jgi:hypothetical protein
MADEKDQALRACLAQGFEPIKADQYLHFSSDEFIDEVKKGIAAVDENRLVEHHKLKSIWEAKRAQITEIVT